MPPLDETLDALAEAEGEAPFSWTVWSCRMKLKIYLLWLDLPPLLSEEHPAQAEGDKKLWPTVELAPIVDFEAAPSVLKAGL